MKRDVVDKDIAKSKLTSVPMGVDLDQFEPVNWRLQRTRSVPLLIGYLGALNSERQVVVLIDMLDVLRRQFRLDARLVLVGEGRDSSDRLVLTRRASELDLQHAVRITGFLPRNEALDELRETEICISPFLPIPILLSTSPTKLIEYMALGILVVANDHPEQSVIIDESNAGVCVPWGATHFAEAVQSILSMPADQRRSMGRRGREWVEKNRTYSIICDHLEDTYASLI